VHAQDECTQNNANTIVALQQREEKSRVEKDIVGIWVCSWMKDAIKKLFQRILALMLPLIPFAITTRHVIAPLII